MALMRRLLGEFTPEHDRERAHIRQTIADADEAVKHAKQVIAEHEQPCNGTCRRRRVDLARSLIEARDGGGRAP